ncbi:hypothetical protein CRENBAI_010609 [Crenichthys baileyi]|uniref:DNA-directed DNA polymerase n=1 Tax=Crenichthys baileyi TaxID=28760 RepID=A0AAV9QVR8_9TELE
MVCHLEMYRQMLKSMALLVCKAGTERGLLTISAHVEKFNKGKAKLGHFKMNGCGLNVIDLYRVPETRDIKFTCISMKLNNITVFFIAKVREVNCKPPKDARKLCKLADVSYSRTDDMFRVGGKDLFAMLMYNLVDSQIWQEPLSKSWTLASDGIPGERASAVRARMHGRGFRVRPLIGLHYVGPGIGLELSFYFSSMYPSIMCAFNISPETIVLPAYNKFPYNLSGWVCFNWEAEGFEYASLILKYDQKHGCLL